MAALERGIPQSKKKKDSYFYSVAVPTKQLTLTFRQVLLLTVMSSTYTVKLFN